MASKKEIVKMITPLPLTESQRSLIKTKLNRITDLNHMIFQEEIDPSLVGGIIVICGEIYIDCSLKTQFNKIRESLLREGIV